MGGGGGGAKYEINYRDIEIFYDGVVVNGIIRSSNSCTLQVSLIIRALK